MKNPWKWIIGLIVLLALPGLACQLVTGDSGDQEDAAGSGGNGQGVVSEDDAGAEAEQSVEDEAVGGAPAFSEIATVGQGLERFDSYRVQMQMDVTGAGDGSESGSMILTSERVNDPPASRTTMSVSGDFGEGFGDLPLGAEMNFTEVGGSSYVVLPGFGCISGGEAEAAAPTDQFADLLDTQEVVGEISDAEFVGEETVNGQATYHYRFDQDDLRQGGGDMRELSGDIYVAKEERYTVRMIVDGVGDVGDLGSGIQGEGNIHLQYDVSDVGQSITIDVPEECGSAGSQYPVMEGATGLSSFEGLTTYSVRATLEEVANFYQEEMAAAGYEAGSDPVTMEDLVMLSFTAPDRPDVSVTLNTEGDSVNVLITSGDG